MGKGRWGCEQVWGEVWESVWGECGEVCWGVGEVRGGVYGVWGKARGDKGLKKSGRRCGRVYGGECRKVLWGVRIGEG